jgi:crotonobetainyl-CoA:carnitine CoA-transferase CaiB-like acyl-CoA transferase
MDGIIQALSGIMMTSGGEDDPPVRIGVPFADLGTPLFAVIGIVSALYHRQQTGKGQYIDVSMLGALTALQSAEPFKVLEDLGVPMRTGPTVPRLSPFGVYPTSDGAAVLCCSGDVNFLKLVKVMDRPDLANDERFASQPARLQHYSALDAEIAAWTASLPTTELIARLEAGGVAAAQVRTPDQAIHDERVRARREVVPIVHPEHGQTQEIFGPGVPIVFSRTPANMERPISKLGEHNLDVYRDLLGLSPEEIERLRKEAAI